MKQGLPGIGGSLFPGRFLAASLAEREGADRSAAAGRRLEDWWLAIDRACGPASGVRTLFDRAAMPLAAMLGFRARRVSFGPDRISCVLQTPSNRSVALLVLPWAERVPQGWRGVWMTSRELGSRWCMVLSCPFLSLIDAGRQITRRSVDFDLRLLATRDRAWQLLFLTAAEAFEADPSRLDSLLHSAALFQDRVRTDLQNGVAVALGALRPLMTSDSRNRAASGSQQPQPDDLRQALAVVYRILFLLFAESRELTPVSNDLFRRLYSVEAMCREAVESREMPGAWDGLSAVSRLARVGCRTPHLIVQPFNGRLFARTSAPALEPRRMARRRSRRNTARDEAMRQTLVALGSRAGSGGREPISFADLGVEQLGAVYERILDWTPAGQEAGTRFARNRPRPHSLERKQSGTFYTPRSLAEFVVRRTLAPLVVGLSPEEILDLRVLDPAMGSGAFLVAACRYLADAYARSLVDEGRARAADLDREAHANIRRLVAERCLAGVDLNETAVQLARLSLWLTTLAEGKPLGFLDGSLRVGNSLIGVSPDDLSRTGRRPALALPLFDENLLTRSVAQVSLATRDLRLTADDSVENVHRKERLWAELTSARSPLECWRLASDLWCARWFWPASSPPVSDAELRSVLHAVLRGDRTLRPEMVKARLAVARSVARDQRFFHWQLEFSDCFYGADGRPKTKGGFDAIVGNPPWEVLRRDHTADARNSERSPTGLVRFVRDSGLYRFCDRGHMNLYQPFLERARALVRPGGRLGLVLPWSLATDDGALTIREEFVRSRSLHSIVGLDNREGLFPIHRGLRFLVVVAGVERPVDGIRARFGVTDAGTLEALPGRDLPDEDAFPVRLEADGLRRIGAGGTRIPDIRRRADLDLLEWLAARFPPLGHESGWRARFGRELNATEDRRHFTERGLPVVEGKHLSPFRVNLSRVTERVPPAVARKLLPDLRFDSARLGYRDVSGVGNRFALVSAVVPAGAVTTHTVYCLRTILDESPLWFLAALLNSHVLNLAVRLLMGSHVTTSLVEGLPVPTWTGDAIDVRISSLARLAGDGRADDRELSMLQALVALRFELPATLLEHVLDVTPSLSPEGRRSVIDARATF